ncbi:HdeD family acid-resistance protein [Streptomyces sp. Li-HN-5-11]|uniref:HdeD family acid-resistance protein n=1 Tax=Streptomyces sp. Li-HN-5-11 TaxID=3075432 RepID=UPI0028AE630A|nr:HdeD family acid-resistance protein [Streptomyces sp. Li-HN-5-11]WNM33406.1 HdeD family acid-resistance protein [Streptomyces sp. Li-HN-5-11]
MTSPSASSSPVPPRGTEPQEGRLTEGMAGLANIGWQVLLTMGLATIALGVIALVWPGETLRVVGVLFGIYLLATGVFQLAAAFGTHVPRHLRVLHFVAGAASVLLGLICFRGPLESIFLLALWIGFSWLMRGTLETVAAASDQAMPARGWHVAFGIIGAMAGIVMIIMPFASIATLTLVVGVMAIVLGLTEVVRAIMTRVEIGHLAAGEPTQRRPLFHARPHPQH